MASKLEMMIEAEKRGILPPKQVQMLDEARNRGLMSSESPSDPVSAPGPSQRQAEDQSMAELTANPPDTSQRSVISEITKGWVNRPGAMMVGGTLGTLAGVPAAVPSFGTSLVAGGALGGAGFGQLYDAAESLTRRLMGRASLKRTTRQAFATAGKDLAEEAMFTAGAGAAGPLIRATAKPLARKILGVGAKQAKAGDLARSQGLHLGIAHVSKSKAVRGAGGVIGVFPFVGTPIRKGQVRVVGQIDAEAADLLNTLAPMRQTSLDLGERLASKAAKQYKSVTKIQSSLYRRFYDLAEELPEGLKEILPTDGLKNSMAEIAESAAKGKITLTTGKQMEGLGSDPLGDWMKQINDLPDRITVEQARELERTLNHAVRTAGKEGYDVSRLGQIKGALADAKNNLDLGLVPTKLADEIMGAWNDANKFFGKSEDLFKTATAKRFGRVDRNMFNKSFFKAGTVDRDQLFKGVFESRSVNSLKDLRKIVGPEEFKNATREYLEQAWQASRVPAKEGAGLGELFSAQAFEKKLGLNTKEGWATLKEMLKDSPVKAQDWKAFLEATKSATDITIRDPSKFVARRLILNPTAQGLLGGLVMSAGAISFPKAALIALAARGGMSGLMRPGVLRKLTSTMNNTIPDDQKRALVMRLINLADDGRGPSGMSEFDQGARPKWLK